MQDVSSQVPLKQDVILAEKQFARGLGVSHEKARAIVLGRIKKASK
jgi:hypothetical protein